MLTFVLFIGVILIIVAVKYSGFIMPDESKTPELHEDQDIESFFTWDEVENDSSIIKVAPTKIKVASTKYDNKIEDIAFEGDLTKQKEGDDNTEKFEFDLRKAVLYSEIINRKY